MSSTKSEMIEFPSNSHLTPAYLATPDDGAAHAAVVAIQEWWGLVPHIKEVADRFASEGIIALAPDLYHGKVASEPDEAKKLAMGLDRARAVREIEAAGKYLQALKTIGQKRIGVVGWCMGGGLALSAAAEGSEFSAVVAFYGRPLDPGDVAKLKAPVLGLYGEEDHSISVSAVSEFQAELSRNKVVNEIHIYPGAGHAFFNDARPGIYHADAARDAWSKTLAWLNKYLG